MFGSVVLDVAIGMAFVFLLLSLIASVVQEMLSSFMQLRAANLEKGLHSLFSGDSLGSEMDLVNSIYDHGLVRGLYSDPKRDSGKIPGVFRKVMNWVRTMMRRMRIEALYRRPNTSKPAPGHKIYPYLLRGLAVDRPNQVWARLAKVPAAKPLE